MRRILNPAITSFDAFYKALVGFVHTGKPCYSVRDKKEYQSWMEEGVICMSGEDRKNPSLYDKSQLEQVFNIVRKSDNIKTEMLKEAVSRERSPTLALMVASGVVVEKL